MPLVLRDGKLIAPTGDEYDCVAGTGYWDFMPRGTELDRPEWKIWEQLQANGLVSYQADPEHNLGVGRRDDFLQFADFCDFRGKVLDVGVGPQRCPTHIEYCDRPDVFFVGIDPFVGSQTRCFTFVRGLGEFLPFRTELFDQVLFVTSLDHFIDPRPPLREAARVLSKGGDICVWLGEKDKNAPRAAVTNPWYEKLTVPEGAEDRFHFKRFSAAEFAKYLGDISLEVVDQRVIRIDQWRSNLFYRLHRRT